jgi:hypothetical protein
LRPGVVDPGSKRFRKRELCTDVVYHAIQKFQRVDHRRNETCSDLHLSAVNYIAGMAFGTERTRRGATKGRLVDGLANRLSTSTTGGFAIPPTIAQ